MAAGTVTPIDITRSISGDAVNIDFQGGGKGTGQTFAPSAVLEPASLSLFLGGLLGVGVFLRKRVAV
jgi:hypothetical protein